MRLTEGARVLQGADCRAAYLDAAGTDCVIMAEEIARTGEA